MARDIESSGECPMCGKAAVFAHPKGRVKHCFACGMNTKDSASRGVEAVLDGVFQQAHAGLLKSKKVMRLLTGERKLHRQVVVDSMLGIASKINVAKLCKAELSTAETHLKNLQIAREGKRGRPSKEEQAALDTAATAVDGLKTLQRDLQAFLDEHHGRLLFFYTTAQHRIVRIRAEVPDATTNAEFSLAEGRGAFNHALFAPVQRARSLESLQDRSIIVATEFDALQLQSSGARLAESEGLCPEAGYLQVAAVGPTGVDTSTLKPLGRMPLVVKSGEAQRRTRVVDAIRQTLNLHSVTVPDGETLDGFIRQQSSDGAMAASLQKLVAKKALVTRAFSAVRADIDAWRAKEAEGTPKFEADRWASWELLQDLRERGILFHDGQMAYAFEKETKRLYPIDRDNTDTQLFLNGYGIAPGDSFCRAAVNAVRLEAQEHGTKTTVYPLSHYDRETNRLYLFDQDRWVYRISKSRIEKLENGADNVLFVRNPKWAPFVISTPKGDGKAVINALLGSVRLREGLLTRREMEAVFANWLDAMFFPELFPTRPLLAMVGEKGSGKTSILRRIGRLLFGPSFQVMGMSHEPRDFDAAVTGDAFVGIDNADGDVKWLSDKLAVAATGGTLKRRMYYTTNSLVEFPITAFIGITSRTPHFKREDVADRLLLFHVERLEEFGAESDLLNDLRSRRNELMTELVGRLQRVLGALEKTKGKSYATSFRLADFAQFMLRISDAESRRCEAEDILTRLAAEQLAFTAQDDPVLELLDIWVRDNSRREVTTSELFGELRELAASSKPARVLDFRSASGFGQYLQDNKATLRALFGANDRTGGAGKRFWTFCPSADVKEEVRGEDEEDSTTSVLEALEKLRDLHIP